MSPELQKSLLKLLDEHSNIDMEAIHDFPSLINNMLQLELKQEITILRKMLIEHPETFKEQFKERCWEGGFEGEKYIAFLEMPQGLISQLYWDIAALTFKPKTMKEMLKIILSATERGSESQVVSPENESKEALKQYLKPVTFVFDSVENLDKLHQRLSPNLYDTLWKIITPSEPQKYLDELSTSLKRNRFTQKQQQALAKAITNYYHRFNGQDSLLLWAVQTNNRVMLKEVLATYPEKERVAVVKKELELIQQKYAVENPESLQVILEIMDEKDRLSILDKGVLYQLVKKHSTTFLGISETIIGVLKLLSPTDRFTALSLNAWPEINTVLHEIAKDQNLFKAILELLPENERMAVIDTLYENKNGIPVLHKTHQPEELLALLPSPEERLHAVGLRAKGKTLLHVAANNPKILQATVNLLPKEELSVDHFLMKQDKDNFTVLHHAAKNPESIKIALELLLPIERLSALQVTNQVIPWENKSKFRSVLDNACYSPDYEDCIKVTLELLPIKDRLPALQTKGFHDQSMMDFVLANPELTKSVQELLPEDQRSALSPEKSESPPQRSESKLVKITMDMVETITNNIKTKKNSRITSAQSGKKINALNAFGEWLEKNKQLEETDPINEMVVPLFHAICKIKRHQMNFFSNPHSLKESKTLIKNNWNSLKKHHNEHIKFTRDEVSKIDSVESIELLLKEKIAEPKPTKSHKKSQL
jgi:hypothetical protein